MSATRFGGAGVLGKSGGGVIATDTDPNTAAPDDGRVLDTPVTPGATSVTAYVGATDGTSVTVQMWFFDSLTNKWLKSGTATACLALIATSFTGLPKGARLFPQVTAATLTTFASVGFFSGPT